MESLFKEFSFFNSNEANLDIYIKIKKYLKVVIILAIVAISVYALGCHELYEALIGSDAYPGLKWLYVGMAPICIISGITTPPVILIAYFIYFVIGSHAGHYRKWRYNLESDFGNVALGSEKFVF